MCPFTDVGAGPRDGEGRRAAAEIQSQLRQAPGPNLKSAPSNLQPSHAAACIRCGQCGFWEQEAETRLRCGHAHCHPAPRRSWGPELRSQWLDRQGGHECRVFSVRPGKARVPPSLLPGACREPGRSVSSVVSGEVCALVAPHVLLAPWAGGVGVPAPRCSQPRSTGALSVRDGTLGFARIAPALRPVLLIP